MNINLVYPFRRHTKDSYVFVLLFMTDFASFQRKHVNAVSAEFTIDQRRNLSGEVV